MSDIAGINWRQFYDFIEFDIIDSTNDRAKIIAQQQTSRDSVLLTHTQTKGKGQRDRSWSSLEGNMHATILLKNTDIPFENFTNLPLLTANILHQTITSLADSLRLNLNIKVKWPNDILIQNKKVAGILVESFQNNNNRHIAIGIGVNVAQSPKLNKTQTVPHAPHPTSLYEHKITVEVLEFLELFMQKFQIAKMQWSKDFDFEYIKNYWIPHAYKIKQKIQISDGQNIISGIFEDISQNGEALIRNEDDKIIKCRAGDIRIL